jgi:RNA polymerase sigma-70 factor (ECF subfamily)
MSEQAQSATGWAGTEPESLWIQQIAGGDRDAFEKLYKAYAARLFRYLFSMLGDANAAEELVNDVMVAAWKGAGQFRGQSKPSTWLFGIAHHKALNELRRRQPQVVDIEEASEVASTAEGPDTAVRRRSLEQTVRGALQTLSPEHREVMELTFYQGLSYQEIAEIMQCPVNTVKTRMFYARKKLQEALEKEGIIGGAL